jgi:YD repeat-containing protein
MTLLCRISAMVAILLLFLPRAAAANFEYSWDMFYQNSPVSSGGLDYGTYLGRRSGATPSSGTGPSSGAEGSNYYIFLETSGGAANSNNDASVMESGSVWRSTIDNAGAMSFYYHMYGTDIGTLAVEVTTASGSTNNGWQRIWELSGQQHSSSSAAWAKQTLNLDAFKTTFGSFNTVRFVAIAKGGYRGDIAIDLVNFETSTSTILRYRYDALGRVICVEDSNNGNRDFTYDKAGNRSNVSLNTCGIQNN